MVTKSNSYNTVDEELKEESENELEENGNITLNININRTNRRNEESYVKEIDE